MLPCDPQIDGCLSRWRCGLLKVQAFMGEAIRLPQLKRGFAITRLAYDAVTFARSGAPADGR
jgi:hypothetical protein